LLKITINKGGSRKGTNRLQAELIYIRAWIKPLRTSWIYTTSKRPILTTLWAFVIAFWIFHSLKIGAEVASSPEKTPRLAIFSRFWPMKKPACLVAAVADVFQK